ncbi:metallophosphoesterase family protein [Pelolinea submarina]|uniref:Nuclease SbcCD subunit D n=1 Tax=Pelolinea submarina TaxID=913107 RepID=A0A347ZPS4_9CHLR|nr:exonuclease SbcCD subunit D [Pelolinea submarina]REG04680.1 exodeoxyribonuclease I subunit D [Pelolinea submarina]BBB47305.1 exonuclease SbcD [Pelolinea submarina]
MIKVLHFADAHIDLARQGRHDPQSGLPMRVLDFLKALDTIVDAAVEQKVDLVIFAGDAYRDRTPAPTYQREWGRRIMRLSSAGIMTLLVIGNHDVSPASGRAHALQEFDTLQVPNVRVISKPCLLGPDDLNGLPLQVIGIPWLNRSAFAASLDNEKQSNESLNDQIERELTALVESLMDQLDPKLPAILTAHATVQGAFYGSERTIMLGADFVLPGSLVRDPRLDYVALGHIHNHQDLNKDGHPHIVYPGSIERVDFGEAEEQKIFVTAEIERGHAEMQEHLLRGRKFFDHVAKLENPETVNQDILKAFPGEKQLADAIFRLVVYYPREWDALIDESDIRRKAESAFEFHFIRRPQIQARIRLPQDKSVSEIPPIEVLNRYWDVIPAKGRDTQALNKLAEDIFETAQRGQSEKEAG